jgi:pyrroline-5-carboxylate reductase
MKSVLFVGGGKMMQAIVQGLIVRGAMPASFAAIEPHADTRCVVDAMGVQTFSHADNARDLLAQWSVIVLAVKPQSMFAAVSPFFGKVDQHLLISIAAGLRTEDIARWLSPQPTNLQLVRAMPNTPALIGAGVTGLFANARVHQSNRDAAESLLASVGKTLWFDHEHALDAVTAVSGSGPAYVFYAIEALEQAAIEQGISADVARVLALETFRGAALLAAGANDAPAVLRANVTSKRGTTEAALRVLNEADVATQFSRAVAAATARARELGDELGRAELGSVERSVAPEGAR